MIQTLFKKIQYIGIKHSDSLQMTKQIILLNWLCLLYIFMPLPNMIFYFWADLPIFAALNPITVAFFTISFYLNSRGKQLKGSIWLIFCLLIAICIYTTVFGMEAGIHYVLFPLFLTPSVLITEKYKTQKTILTGIIILSYISLEISQFFLSPLVILTPQIALISRLIFLTDAFIIFFILIYFKRQMINQLKLNLHHYLKIYKLTQRESEIVVEVCNGLNNKDIAKKLFVEEGTVKTHLNNIFKKLNVKARSELVSLTFKSG